MEYAKRKKQLLESLIKKEADAKTSELVSGDSIMNMEDKQGYEIEKLIAEVLLRFKS